MALANCENADNAAAAPAPNAAAEAPAPAAPEVGGADFDPIAQLSGTWVLPMWRGDSPSNAPWGMRMLWEVEGSVLTESNGVTTLASDLKRVGPCLVKAKRQDKNKVSHRAMVFDGGELLLGSGGFDSPDGRYVHVCQQLFGRYLRVERGVPSCTFVEQQLFGASQTCAVERHDDEHLVIDTGDKGPLELVRQGKVWVEDKPGGAKPAKRYANRAAAMAELTGK